MKYTINEIPFILFFFRVTLRFNIRSIRSSSWANGKRACLAFSIPSDVLMTSLIHLPQAVCNTITILFRREFNFKSHKNSLWQFQIEFSRMKNARKRERKIRVIYYLIILSFRNFHIKIDEIDKIENLLIYFLWTSSNSIYFNHVIACRTIYTRGCHKEHVRSPFYTSCLP